MNVLFESLMHLDYDIMTPYTGTEEVFSLGSISVDDMCTSVCKLKNNIL